MPVSATTLRLLMDAGLEGERLIAVVASIDNDNSVPVRSAAAERQARYRGRKASHSDVTRDVTGDVTPPDKERSPLHPPKETNPVSSLRSETARAVESEFTQTFWPGYPHKVGKPAAQRAFLAARKRAGLEAIMAGLERYIRGKPADRPYLNPATFLHQERWADEPANSASAPEPSEEKRMTWPEKIAWSHAHDGYWPESLLGMKEDVPAEFRHLLEQSEAA